MPCIKTIFVDKHLIGGPGFHEPLLKNPILKLAPQKVLFYTLLLQFAFFKLSTLNTSREVDNHFRVEA